MGYTRFSSYDNIIEYEYKTKGEIQDALGALESMYKAGNITDYQYNNVKKLLESKL